MKCPYCGAKSETNKCPNCFAEIPVAKKEKDENKDKKEK